MPKSRRMRPAAATLAPVALLASRWIERLLAGYEPPLTPAQYLALRAVADGEAVGADLARRAAVSPAAVSQLLGALEGAGLVERVASRDDRRRQSVTATRSGRRILDAVDELLTERLRILLDELPAPELDALGRSLDALEPLLSGRTPPPRPPRPPHPPRPRR